MRLAACDLRKSQEEGRFNITGRASFNHTRPCRRDWKCVMRDHRRLLAFKLADELVIEAYRATRVFPKEELFGLIA